MERLQLGLELEYTFHPGKVETFVGELLDTAELVGVGVAVAAATAAGARGIDEALALVDTQRLRVHARQLGRHRDDVQRAIVVGHPAYTSRCSRGLSGNAAA